jgi:prevent-host-death family protein
VVATYDQTEVDAVAVYCGDLDRCYFLPIDLAAGRGVLSLRLKQTRNNQRAALNWAAEYEFQGAVAQLAERVDGIDEAEGSSPSSSTPQLSVADVVFPERNDFTDLKETVGMDEFYAKLAQYVRRAESGQETAVTRWGRPVARLVPAKLG